MTVQADLSKLIKYHTLRELTPPGYWVTAIYGEFGKRKTTTACSMVKEKGLLIASDNSWRVLLKEVHKDLLDRITLVEYDSLSQLEYLDLTSYDTVIFDTFSKMVSMYVDLLFDHANWGGKYREKLVTQHKELKGTEKNAPVDYMVTRDKFRPVIHNIIRAPIHKIFTSHAAIPLIGLSTDLTKRPAIPQGTWALVAEQSNIIGFIDGDDKKGFTIGVDEAATAYQGKSQVEGISGKMNLNAFIAKYRETI